MRYRDFEISYDPKPIPDRRCDWTYFHIDCDGPEDRRFGFGASWRECVDEINDQLYDDEPERFFTIGDGLDGSLVVHGDETLFDVARDCYGRHYSTLVDRCQQRRYGAS